MTSAAMPIQLTKILLTCLLSVRLLTIEVQGQTTTGWGSGESPSESGFGEETTTNYPEDNPTTSSTSYETTTYFTSDNPTTNFPSDEPTTYFTTDVSTISITTNEPTTFFTTAVSCESTCIGSNQECMGELCLCIDDFVYDDDGYCSRVCPKTCPGNSTCTNAENGCECNQGFTNETGKCEDVNECVVECLEVERHCTNFLGFFSCECADGYYPENENCIEESPGCPDCAEHAACIDPGIGCECVEGWTGLPSDCQDLDDCLTECEDPTLICTNTPGSFYCSCLDGYTAIDDDVDAGCIPETCPEEQLSCDSAPDNLCDFISDVVVFPATLFGYSSKSTNSCVQSTTNSGKPYGTRFCSVVGSWDAPQWLSSCNEGLKNLSAESIETEEQREQVSSDLEVLTSNPEELDTDDIETATAVIEDVTAAKNITPVVATSVISTISNVAESPSLADSGQTEELLTQLDDVASKVLLVKDEPYIAVSNNVSMVVTEAKSRSSGGIGVALLERPDSASLGFRADQLQTIDQAISSGNVLKKNMVQGSIYVPASALSGGSRVAVYVFGNNNLFPASSNQSSSPDILSPNNTLVNGIVFSATVNSSGVRNLPDDDRLLFSNPIDNNASDGNPRCAFWDEDVNAWSTRGCEVDFENTTNVSISCICNHLTNFATLLDLSSSVSDPVLDLLTVIGCSISSVALILTLATFIFVPAMRKGRKFRASFLLMNLSVSLLGLNLALIVSEMNFLTSPLNVDATKSSCIAVAVFLHLFLLCTWGWMNCEAANLYIAIQKPIYSRNELRTSRVVIFTSLWGWLMPVIFVGITLAANISVYERPYEGEYKVTCWIEKDMVLYLAVIPVAVMLGFNLVIYGILTYSLCRSRKNNWGKTWKSNRKTMANRLIVNFCLMLVVGVTWVFGILLSAFSFNQTTAKVFAYIFTILNSLQGLFIFLLYILRSKEVRKSIKVELLSLSGSLTSNTDQKSTRSRSRTESKHISSIENPYTDLNPVVGSASQNEDYF